MECILQRVWKAIYKDKYIWIILIIILLILAVDWTKKETQFMIGNKEMYIDVLRKELMSEWEHSGSQNLDQRESIWLAIRLLEKIKGHITSIVETGHMAKVLEKQHPYI